MPEISRFLGIVIAMYRPDHGPPHVHVRYAGRQAKLGWSPPRLLAGELPPRVIGLVMEWAALHAAELDANWRRAGRHEPLDRIAPLE
jgi:hypothetical protein